MEPKKTQRKTVNSSIIDSLKNDTPLIPENNQTKDIIVEEISSENTASNKNSNLKLNQRTGEKNDDNIIFREAGVPFRVFDKTTKKLSYMSEVNHNKLSLLANETGYSIMDMNDSILSHFFEQNKDTIKKVMQKNVSNTWG